jgi:hypothetical protein
MERERVIKRCRATSTPRGCHESSKSSSPCCVHSPNPESLSPAGAGAIGSRRQPLPALCWMNGRCWCYKLSYTVLQGVQCRHGPGGARESSSGEGWELHADACPLHSPPQPQQLFRRRESHRPCSNIACTSSRVPAFSSSTRSASGNRCISICDCSLPRGGWRIGGTANRADGS